MSDKNIFEFHGKDIDVFWDSRLCIHLGECSQAKGDLFVSGRHPWCLPDVTTVESVVDVVGRCPSGALTFENKVEKSEQADSENTVTVVYNGPLFARGDLEVEGARDDMPGVRYRAALCRCGESKNKPFCDNSHEEVGFKDYGAVGETATVSAHVGGKLKIKPLKNGPLLLSGNVVIKAGTGRVAWSGNDVALCRCGKSKNKPFCDGSHTAEGFQSE